MGLSRDNRLMAAALLLWGVGEGLFAYIQPLYLKQLGADPATIGAVLAVAAGVAVFFHLPAGYLSDHLGRKQVLLVGWGLGLLATVLMFAANSLETFTVALVLYTTTMFVGGPINSYVVEARGAQSEQRALTLVSAGFWGGTIASPAVGGWIGQEFGLRWVYGVALVMFVLSCLAIFFLRPQALVVPEHGQSRYAELFTNRRFINLMALMFFAFFGIQVGLPLMPNFVQEVRGYNVQAVGWLGTVTSASTVLVNLRYGQRAPRRGFFLAQILLFLSMAFLLMVNGWPGVALAYAFRASWPLARNMANAQVRRVVSAAEIGLAFGVFETVGALALALGPWLAGQLYARAPALPFQASLILIALAAPVVWLFAPRREESVEAVAAPLSTEAADLSN